MKKSKLLQVMSIIFIFTGLSGIYNNISQMINPASAEDLELLSQYGLGSFPAWTYILLAITSGIGLIAGIVGVTYKSRNLVKIMGILYLVSIIVSSVASGVFSPLGWLSLFGVISPILYLWGLSKSE